MLQFKQTINVQQTQQSTVQHDMDGSIVDLHDILVSTLEANPIQPLHDIHNKSTLS